MRPWRFLATTILTWPRPILPEDQGQEESGRQDGARARHATGELYRRSCSTSSGGGTTFVIICHLPAAWARVA